MYRMPQNLILRCIDVFVGKKKWIKIIIEILAIMQTSSIQFYSPAYVHTPSYS